MICSVLRVLLPPVYVEYVTTDAVDSLLEQAWTVYRGVVTDPGTYAGQAGPLADAARRSRDHEAHVVALRAQAWAERSRLADGRAKALLDEAARVARRHGLSARLVEILTSRSAVNLELGRIPAARRDLDLAEAMAGEHDTAALALQHAVLLHNLGRLTEAATYYRRALADSTAAPETRATVANNLALVEMVHGRVPEAFAALDEAHRAAAGAGPALVALVTQTSGWVSVQAGRISEGLARFDSAARLYAAAGLPLAEHYLEYVDALVDLRLLPEALATSRAAVDELDGSDVVLMAAEARLRLARLALLSGDPDRAADVACGAARMFRSQHRSAWAAQADVLAAQARGALAPVTAADLTLLRRAAGVLESRQIASAAIEAHLAAGRAAIELGRPAAALVHLDTAWSMARAAPVLPRLNGRVAAALASGVRGDDAAVLRHCRAGLADLAGHRSSFESAELRALASGHGAELGRIALALALTTGSATRVLQWMELTRAAALVAVDPEPVDDQDDHLAALRAAHAELDRSREAGDSEPPALLARVRDLERRARRATWSQHSTAPAPAGAVPRPVLRSALGQRVLVEYGRLDGMLFATVLSARRARLVELGPVAAVEREASALLFALRRMAAPASPRAGDLARAGADLALGRLRVLLIEPLRLPDAPEHVVVPSSSLWRVPWSALLDGPVSLSPSAAQWVRTLHSAAAPHLGTTVLVAGPGLPGAVREVEALRVLHPQALVLAPPDSSVDRVTAALAGADLVHLACHCVLRADNPAFSSLRLGDGPLSVHEIDLRGLAPRRVVLAACDSAADVAYEGDEMLGFVSALLARGTTALVASVVPVPDLDAVPLMVALHEQLGRGVAVGPALHAARTAIDQDEPRAFVSWCAFTAVGAG